MSRLQDFLSGFSGIRVISLTRRADRRASLLRSLLGAGVSEAFISERIKTHFAEPRQGEHMARGCFASHAAVCAEALSEGLDNVLVLEDDAWVMAQPLPGIWRQASLVDWTAMYLGGNPGTDLDGADISLARVKDTLTAHAVAYSRRGMRLVVDGFRGGEGFVSFDHYLKQMQETELCVGVVPMLFTQASGMSDIERHAVDYWFIADSWRKRTAFSGSGTKHELVKVCFFIPIRQEDVPALRITLASLGTQRYGNFEVVLVSDENIEIPGGRIKTSTFIGSMEDAVTDVSCHVACKLVPGDMVHPGVCYTVVQDYRTCEDGNVVCSDLSFSYDKTFAKGRLIPWVYSGEEVK